MAATKRFHVTTFGCQMNEHDSERMKGMLESLGYAEVPERADADLILFNTCSIREKADERFIAHLHEAKALKRRDPDRLSHGHRHGRRAVHVVPDRLRRRRRPGCDARRRPPRPPGAAPVVRPVTAR